MSDEKAVKYVCADCAGVRQTRCCVQQRGHRETGAGRGVQPGRLNAQIATTLTSVFLGCKYAIPLLRAQGGGVIINMASVAGQMGIKDRAIYSAAKGGVIGLTRAIALDHATEQIRCVYLSPATIETPSLRDRIETSPDPVAARKAFEARQPIGRLGRPEDVANAALYLASDESGS